MSGREPRTVSVEVDTRAFLESEEQLDSVVRELQLLALSSAQSPEREAAARLLPMVRGFMQGFAHIRLNNRVQAQTAGRHGERTVRLSMTLAPEAAGVFTAFIRLLDEVDGYWQEWGLLAWSQTDDTKAVRRAMLEAIVAQVVSSDSDR